VRERVVFSFRDYTWLAPFTGLDIVSPRSILVYLNKESQKKLIPMIHSTLNPHGILFLGTPNIISQYKDLYSTLDSKWKIYARRARPGKEQARSNR